MIVVLSARGERKKSGNARNESSMARSIFSGKIASGNLLNQSKESTCKSSSRFASVAQVSASSVECPSISER